MRTLTVLHRLDEERKRSVLLFLFDAGLIYKDKNNIVNLSGADLREVDLSLASLREVDLSSANLSGAYIVGAHLNGADLSGADLELR